VTRVYHGKGFDCEPELPDIICELGWRFTEGAICPSDDPNFTKSYEDPHEPYALAGGRLPHVALTSDNGKTMSSLDLVKQNFVLFTADPGSPWLQAAKGQKIPVDAFALNSESAYRCQDQAARKTWKLAEGEAMLVRPDGIIAWRSGVVSESHAQALSQALTMVLAQ